MTAQSVASLPVPAVVGTATSGGIRLVIGVPPYSYSTIEPPWAASTPIDFAVSIELPPPRATRPSQPASTYAARARPTSSMSGFARTSSKRTAFSRCASVASARPAATTPLSVTSRGRLTPSSATSSPTRAIAPAPWTIRVGTSTVRTVSTSTLIGWRAYRNAAATDRAVVSAKRSASADRPEALRRTVRELLTEPLVDLRPVHRNPLLRSLVGVQVVAGDHLCDGVLVGVRPAPALDQCGQRVNRSSQTSC